MARRSYSVLKCDASLSCNVSLLTLSNTPSISLMRLTTKSLSFSKPEIRLASPCLRMASRFRPPDAACSGGEPTFCPYNNWIFIRLNLPCAANSMNSTLWLSGGSHSMRREHPRAGADHTRVTDHCRVAAMRAMARKAGQTKGARLLRFDPLIIAASIVATVRLARMTSAPPHQGDLSGGRQCGSGASDS